MKVSIISVFPELHQNFLNTSLIARAVEKGLISFDLIKLSDMCEPKVRIDEPCCGPGAGMIIKPEIIEKAINAAQDKFGPGYKIIFSPQGKKLDQFYLKKLAERFFNLNNETCHLSHSDSTQDNNDLHIILVCSRYEGIDARVEEVYADEIISIGDYVLMGGDLPAQVFLEGLLRLFPGIVGRTQSVEKESFTDSFLDHPEYGLPVEWKGLKIPEIVLSGNHAEIEKWRKLEAAKKTVKKRFDWFLSSNPSKQDIDVAKKFIPKHYVTLMHSQVMVKDGTVGHTSIASLDIHDVARSCATYGIENYFIISSLIDQRKILDIFLDFWRSDVGRDYNESRFFAVNRVVPADNIDMVIDHIETKEGKRPLVITTSAKFSESEKDKYIDYSSQNIVFDQERPVLFVFGTGQGLSPEVINKSDYLLLPVNGLTDYNHLSVRSAVAIILDRWLGLKPRKN